MVRVSVNSNPNPNLTLKLTTRFQLKVYVFRWRLEHLGALGTMGDTAPHAQRVQYVYAIQHVLKACEYLVPRLAHPKRMKGVDVNACPVFQKGKHSST